MEKLGDQGNIHMGNDLCIWFHYISGSIGTCSIGKYQHNIVFLHVIVCIMRVVYTCLHTLSIAPSKDNFLLLQILCIQIKCFHEIINIGYVVYRSHDLPWFRTLSWYFMICSNYFFYGESMIQYFGVLLSRTVRLNCYYGDISYGLAPNCAAVFSASVPKGQEPLQHNNNEKSYLQVLLHCDKNGIHCKYKENIFRIAWNQIIWVLYLTLVKAQKVSKGRNHDKHLFEPTIAMVIFNDSLLKMSKIKQIYYSLIVTGIEARSRKCLWTIAKNPITISNQ